jgi:hypothetical protein
VLGWAGALWRTAFFGLLGLAAVIVVDVLLRRRWDLARDLLVAAVGVVGMAVLLGRAVESDWFPLKVHLLSRWGYPELRLAGATAVIVVVGPELVRTVRVVATWLVPLAALGEVVLGAALPSGALAGLALGLGAGALARLIFGSAAGVPPTAQVRGAMVSLGVEVSDLEPSAQQHVGAAEYVGQDKEGNPSEGQGAGSGCAGHATPRHGSGDCSRTRIPREAPPRVDWSRSSTRRWPPSWRHRRAFGFRKS